MKKNIFKTLLVAMLMVCFAANVGATTAYTCSAGLNACLGMYGDARYEHYPVGGGELVTLSGNSNDELTGFYYDGMELFIQPYLLDVNYGSSYSSNESSSYSSSSGTNDGSGAYNRIDVNLSTQKLKHYNWNYEMDFICEICSGKPGYDTPTGWYSILYKETNTSLKGTNNGVDYDKPVDYWMPFLNTATGSQMGFHDTSWKYVYSGLNTSNGSLGCINMNPGDAAMLYSLCESGTTVYIHY